jgi:diacylglycerol kinase family enzyme
VSSPFGKAVVIADRRAGLVGRDLDGLRDMVSGSGLDFEIRPTAPGAGPAVLARAAIEDGLTFLVAAGDDATIHRVVNGMMDDAGPRNPEAVLGVIPAGSDFIRTFGLPQDPRDAVGHLRGGNLFDVDVGLIRCRSRGEPQSRWFVNVAEAGFGGEIVRSGGLPLGLSRVRTLLSFWRALGTFSPVPSHVVLDERTYDGPVTNVVVANGQFIQDARPVAPRAHPGDGKFDVLIAKGTKREYVETLTRMPKGTHLPSRTIREYMAHTVVIEGDAPLAIGADGLSIGETPARFDLFERALRLKI